VSRGGSVTSTSFIPSPKQTRGKVPVIISQECVVSVPMVAYSGAISSCCMGTSERL
jgi:hypothetical protein